MTHTRTARPTDDVGDYLQQQVDEISYIYRTLFPENQLRILFYKTDDPFWAAPKIIHGPFTIEPDHVGYEYLGLFEIDGPRSDAHKTTILISIPPRLTADDIAETNHQWRPSSWLHRAVVFGLSPTLFEHAKFLRENRWRKRVKSAHRWKKLDRNRSLLVPEQPRKPSAKKPAILIGFHWLETGGAENLAFDTVNYALEAGLRVFVISDQSGPQRLMHKLPDSPDVHFVRVDRFLEDHQWPQFLENLIRRENITIAHIHHCTKLYSNLAHLKAWFPSLHVVDSTHIIEHHDGGYPRISGIWSNFIDTHHVISDQLKVLFETEFRVSGNVVLGRLLDETVGAAPITIRTEVKKANYRIAFVGRMTHQKRPFLLVPIMEKLTKWAKEYGITINFDLVGEGPYRSACEKLINRAGLAHLTTWHPAQSDVGSILDNADFLILPSSNEGLALVCYEAAAHRVIPISTNVGAQAELMPPQLLVSSTPHKTVDEIVATVHRLIQDSDYLRQSINELSKNYEELRSEATAHQVLSALYKSHCLQEL